MGLALSLTASDRPATLSKAAVRTGLHLTLLHRTSWRRRLPTGKRISSLRVCHARVWAVTACHGPCTHRLPVMHPFPLPQGILLLARRILTFRRWRDEHAQVPRFLCCFLLMMAELIIENCVVWWVGCGRSAAVMSHQMGTRSVHGSA